ncbi:MAG: hypothetical protein U9R42_04095, partial [Bacteroidota bacterium]|nr:hypothetical protein [Bacteroidota bacterium]
IYDDYLKNLKKSIEDKNIETLSKYALKFEGALNALFAIESKKFAYKLKMKGRRNDTEGIDELFIKFKEAVEKFNNELKVFVDNL